MGGNRIRNPWWGALLLILCIGIGAAPLASHAASSQELREQQKQLEKEKQGLQNQKQNLQGEKAQSEQELNEANANISEIKGEQQALSGEIDAANRELVGILTAIELIKEDIAEKEQQIAETTEAYEEAKRQEEELYAAMKQRVRFLYEQGEFTYAQLLLQAEGFADFLNKADYVNEVYAYDREKLGEFIAAKIAAEELGEQLEEERSELETSEYELEEEQNYMEELIAEFRRQYADFDVQLAQARQQAAVYSAQLKAQTAQLNALQNQIDQKQKDINKVEKAANEAASREAAEKAEKEERRRKEKEAEKTTVAESNAGSGSSTSTQSAPAASAKSYAAPGAATGSNIASYACQFVGNPYVAGGTSLTNGCDCSGFVMSVYKAFGISVPRTSYSQSQYGREVSYENAQAGDVIYYGGHVGIYLGGGRIVHASTPKSGIKYERATYRTILTVRRYI